MGTLIAAAGEGPTLWSFFGAFHPAMVHFPIALLSVAALLELLQLARRKPGLSAATAALTVVGAASSILATLMGWANAGGRPPQDAIELHRWAGVATTLLAVGAALLVLRARKPPGWMLHAARASLFLSLVLVSLTGHWGGVLVYGDSYYSDRWPWTKREDRVLQQTSGGKVDFSADIAPILRESCFSCHGGEKSGKNGKGGLKLTTQALAMKGGDGGACLVPGKPELSSFYTLLLDKDPEKRMPKKEKVFPAEKIDKIRRWIEQGAEWPEGFELKK